MQTQKASPHSSSVAPFVIHGVCSISAGPYKQCSHERREEQIMNKLSNAKPADFEVLLDATKKLTAFTTAEELAQAFIDIVYERFMNSFVLLRLFASLPYSILPKQDRQLVDKKAIGFGTANLLKNNTPVLTLLGTRGQRDEWNRRQESQGFRCIPLLSSDYVESLPMLAMQFDSMHFDLKLLDTWNTAVAAKGHANEYTGMLYVNHAGINRDAKGRMIVPRQEFVAESNVKTAIGFGSGYTNYPAIVTLFAFTNELLGKAEMEPFATLLETYLSISGEFVGNGHIFR